MKNLSTKMLASAAAVAVTLLAAPVHVQAQDGDGTTTDAPATLTKTLQTAADFDNKAHTRYRVNTDDKERISDQDGMKQLNTNYRYDNFPNNLYVSQTETEVPAGGWYLLSNVATERSELKKLNQYIPMAGPGGVFQEGWNVYDNPPKKATVKAITSIDADGKPTEYADKEITLNNRSRCWGDYNPSVEAVTTGGEAKFDMVLSGTQGSLQMGYFYVDAALTDEELKAAVLAAPRYVLDHSMRDTANVVLTNPTLQQEMFASKNGMAMANILSQINESYNAKWREDTVTLTTTVYKLPYFGAKYNDEATYTWPAGKRIVLFIRKETGGLYGVTYASQRINEITGHTNVFQGYEDNYPYDPITYYGLGEVSAVNYKASTYSTDADGNETTTDRYYLGFEDGGGDWDMNDIVFAAAGGLRADPDLDVVSTVDIELEHVSYHGATINWVGRKQNTVPVQIHLNQPRNSDKHVTSGDIKLGTTKMRCYRAITLPAGMLPEPASVATNDPVSDDDYTVTRNDDGTATITQVAGKLYLKKEHLFKPKENTWDANILDTVKTSFCWVPAGHTLDAATWTTLEKIPAKNPVQWDASEDTGHVLDLSGFVFDDQIAFSQFAPGVALTPSKVDYYFDAYFANSQVVRTNDDYLPLSGSGLKIATTANGSHKLADIRTSEAGAVKYADGTDDTRLLRNTSVTKTLYLKRTELLDKDDHIQTVKLSVQEYGAGDDTESGGKTPVLNIKRNADGAIYCDNTAFTITNPDAVIDGVHYIVLSCTASALDEDKEYCVVEHVVETPTYSGDHTVLLDVPATDQGYSHNVLLSEAIAVNENEPVLTATAHVDASRGVCYHNYYHDHDVAPDYSFKAQIFRSRVNWTYQLPANADETKDVYFSLYRYTPTRKDEGTLPIATGADEYLRTVIAGTPQCESEKTIPGVWHRWVSSRREYDSEIGNYRYPLYEVTQPTAQSAAPATTARARAASATATATVYGGTGQALDVLQENEDVTSVTPEYLLRMYYPVKGSVDGDGNQLYAIYDQLFSGNEADGKLTTAIDGIGDDSAAGTEAQGPALYYNLQGQSVAEPLAPGIYLRRQGTVTDKVVIR